MRWCKVNGKSSRSDIAIADSRQQAALTSALCRLRYDCVTFMLRYVMLVLPAETNAEAEAETWADADVNVKAGTKARLWQGLRDEIGIACTVKLVPISVPLYRIYMTVSTLIFLVLCDLFLWKCKLDPFDVFHSFYSRPLLSYLHKLYT